jgi:hypothetical protein
MSIQDLGSFYPSTGLRLESLGIDMQQETNSKDFSMAAIVPHPA